MPSLPQDEKQPHSPSPVEPGGESSSEAGRSPYKNLWAPLILVPALVVMVLALVGLFFGAIGSGDKGVEDYIRGLSGGKNEREQALFGLSQRVAESARARLEGETVEAELDRQRLEPLLEEAWQGSRPDDPAIRYVLAALMAQLGMEDGVPRLISLLDLGEAQDPGAKLRFDVLANLGAMGDERALEALARHAQDPDKGLRSIAVIGLQKLPLAQSGPALRAALGDDALEVRANAAIALSKLGDPGGAAVLRDLLDAASYAAEEGRDPRRFAGGLQVSESRVKVLQALARLQRPEDRELLERLAASEPDVQLRSAAKRALADWGAAAEGGK